MWPFCSPTHGKQPHSGVSHHIQSPARHIDPQTPLGMSSTNYIVRQEPDRPFDHPFIHTYLLRIYASIGVVMNGQRGGGLAQTRGQPCPVSDGSPMAPCPIRTRNRANHAHVEIEIGPQTLQGTPCSGRQFFSPSLTTTWVQVVNNDLPTSCETATRSPLPVRYRRRRTLAGPDAIRQVA